MFELFLTSLLFLIPKLLIKLILTKRVTIYNFILEDLVLKICLVVESVKQCYKKKKKKNNRYHIKAKQFKELQNILNACGTLKA
jgi:hypothetical protein